MMSTVQRLSRQRPLTFISTSSEMIPPYAAMEILSVNLDGTHYVQKPSADDLPPQRVIINGPTSVPASGTGTAQGTIPYRAMFSLDDGPTANRESVGTKANEWELYLGFEGFIVRGQPDEDVGEVIVQPNLTCRDPNSGLYQNLYYPDHGTGFCCGCARFDCTSSHAFPYTLDFTITNSIMGTRTLTMNIGTYNFLPLSVCRGVFDPVSGLDIVSNATVYTGSYFGPAGTVLGNVDLCPSGPSVGFFYDPSEVLTVQFSCTRNYSAKTTVCNGDGNWSISVDWTKVVGGEGYNARFCGAMPINSCAPFYSTSTKSIVCDPTGLSDVRGCSAPIIWTPPITYSQHNGLIGSSVQVEVHE